MPKGVVHAFIRGFRNVRFWHVPDLGKSPDEVRGERVVAVVRNKTLRRFYDPTVATLQTGDHVVVVRHATEEG